MAIRAIRDRQRQAWRALRDARREAFAAEDVREALAAVDGDFSERHRAARAAAVEGGLYWGSYLSVEQSCKSFRSGPPPRFKRFTGEGRVVVQLQGGLSPAALHAGTDQRLRLHRLASRRTNRPRPALVDCRVFIRVGTMPDRRSPVWAQADVTLHRPLPEDCQVKWAYLSRRRCNGTHWRWELQLVLSRDSWDTGDAPASGRVGIDLGWRLLGEDREGKRHLRVAAWVGSDDQRGQLVIPADDLGRWARVEELRGQRDKMFNEARAWLVAWAAGCESLPPWWEERAATLAQWRSPGRLAALVLFWRDNHFSGDAEAFSRMEGRLVTAPGGKRRYVGWRKQDRHLFDWERAQHEKAVRWRNDLYRKFVADMRKRYRIAAVEATDWRDLTETPEVEEGDPAAIAVCRQRFIASPGRLAALIAEGFAGRLSRCNPANTTQTCHQCGMMDAFDAARELVRTCRRCGHTEDQDWRAAYNLLAASGGDADGGPIRLAT